jgi:hypothetical protein
VGIVTVYLVDAVGVLGVIAGIAYIVRGANLPVPAGMRLLPRASEAWRIWISNAPPAFWRTRGVIVTLSGVATLLMGQGCFNHLLFVFGIVAFLAAVSIGLVSRSRYGPFPPRPRSYWVRYLTSYAAAIIAVQALVLSGALNVCR